MDHLKWKCEILFGFSNDNDIQHQNQWTMQSCRNLLEIESNHDSAWINLFTNRRNFQYAFLFLADWFVAVQVLSCVGLFGLLVAIVISTLYMCLHKISKNGTIIALVVTCFVTGMTKVNIGVLEGEVLRAICMGRRLYFYHICLCKEMIVYFLIGF